jgi:DUF1680 family protein
MNEFGGMEEVLWDAQRATGNNEYGALAMTFERSWFIDLLANDDDQLGFLELHANTKLPMVTGMGARYDVTSDDRYRSALLNFCGMLKHHCFAHGATQGVPPSHNRGEGGENWMYPDQHYDQLMAPDQGECCATHNSNEILQKAFTYTADVEHADEFEKRFVNCVMSCQHPEDGGKFIYHLPVWQGSRKVFGSAEDTFWCCYGTGVEALATLTDGTYFHDGHNGLWINQFVSSQLRWPEQGLSVT